MLKNKFLLSIFLLTISVTQSAHAFPKDSRVPGGIAIFDLGTNKLEPKFT